MNAIVLAGRRLALLNRARIYTCGITPYDVTHLGHAATFVWVDTLARVLRRCLRVEPVVCRNVTDVDDVLDSAAMRAGTRSDDFAAFQEFLFEGDMSALHVNRPDHEPWAHRYIGPVIRLAEALLESGAAYERSGTVYFRGADVPARAGVDRATALRLAAEFGGRPGDTDKDDPFDVALWQATEHDHQTWPSPWGQGRPGWHAECVAMALSVLGVGVDVHAGGADLRFPHHAYHAAIAETFTGVVPHTRAWFHVGAVTFGGAKMAKSTGNLVLIADLLAKHPAATVRMMILDRPWHESWDYRPELLDAATDRVRLLHEAAARPGPSESTAVDEVRSLLAADLDVPAALAVADEAGGDAARLLIAVLGLA
ncbi:cysteine--tRNA ligase [Actinophytocola sp.]|uniref:cysteine--tRNA ligase n=1 Tax=Actinophytocola sp. TaxID=1872138 RepID=UPI002ED57289